MKRKRPTPGKTGGPVTRLEGERAVIESMTTTILHATRALLMGRIHDDALGVDVQIAVRGFRAGLMDRKTLMEAVAYAYRDMGGNAVQFDQKGNLKKH